MEIRNATLNDLESLHQIETACFPKNQVASLETLSDRLKAYPQHFWLLEDHGEIVGFINGMITNNETVKDEMFKNTDLHIENGTWQSVFGLAVSPKHQNKGYAGRLLNHLTQVSTKNNKQGIALTCEEHLIPYYEKFGFVNTGLSDSIHGGDVFFDMKKRL